MTDYYHKAEFALDAAKTQCLPLDVIWALKAEGDLLLTEEEKGYADLEEFLDNPNDPFDPDNQDGEPA